MPLLTELIAYMCWGYKDFAPNGANHSFEVRKPAHTVEYEHETEEIRVYGAWLYIPVIEQKRRMARTQRRSPGKKDYKRIDSVLDARLRLLAVGRLDRKSRDKLLIELARNPEWVDRLAEHLRTLSPL